MNSLIDLTWIIPMTIGKLTSRLLSGWSMVVLAHAMSNKSGFSVNEEITNEAVGELGTSPTKELENAFLKMIREHFAMIDLICHSHTKNQEDRKDLYQEILRQLWSAYPSFKGKSKINTWIGGIALRVAKMPFRQNRLKIDYMENLPETSDTPAKELDERLSRLYHQLGESEQQVITLFLEGFSKDEIAVLMDVSEMSIRRRLAKIKKEAEKNQNNKQQSK